MISICTLDPCRKKEFLAFTQQNLDFYKPWTTVPSTPESFDEYVEQYNNDKNISFWVLNNHRIAGVVNLNSIIRGKFQNCFLGYYGSKEFSGSGTMKKGLLFVIEKAFKDLSLHRLECGIQPGNTASLRFIRSLGFHFEGYAPGYLFINEQWCDHFKFSFTKEQWKGEILTSGPALLQEYQTDWASQFQIIKNSIQSRIPNVPIEHIGSTSIPNLAAKPVIDIQLGLNDLDEVKIHRTQLEALGLEYVESICRDHVPFSDIEFEERGWEKRFLRGSSDGIRINLHVRKLGSKNWRFALLFRDFLRENDNVRVAYSQVKKRLCELNITSGVYAYTKDPICDLIHLQAEEWAKKKEWKLPYD